MPAIRLEYEISIPSTLFSYMHIKMIKENLENIFISLIYVVMHAKEAETLNVVEQSLRKVFMDDES